MINDFPNMSYCMIENTANAMEQVLDAIGDMDEEFVVEDLNQYERENLPRLLRLCTDILTEARHQGLDQKLDLCLD